MHYGEHWWQRVWKILDAKGAAGLPIAEGNEFWLEPKDIDGETVFYYVRFEDGGMLDLWKDVRLFPVGTRAPQATLDPWDGANGPLKLQYMAKAQEIAQADDVDITERLEGVIGSGSAREVVRFFSLPGASGGRDWLIIDITAKGHLKQDGTAHGNPK
jgi:hypothetical protein